VPELARAAIDPDWITPLPPFQLADNLYYVGSRELASYLITTPAGNILINANLAGAPAQIRASVEQLGFPWQDTRILLDSQAHSDHVGGAAQVLEETHARLLAMAGDAEVLESGGHADFAWGDDITTGFAAAHVDRVLHDGEVVRLGERAHGGVALLAHRTGGHTRGCTTFSFRVHVPGEPAGRLREVVIVGGVAPLAHYRLLDRPGRPASYPGIAADFNRSFATLRALHGELFLGAHGSYFGLLDKVARLPSQGPQAFIDPQGYRDFVEGAQRRFQATLARR